jgi:hypothetical protein
LKLLENHSFWRFKHFTADCFGIVFSCFIDSELSNMPVDACNNTRGNSFTRALQNFKQGRRKTQTFAEIHVDGKQRKGKMRARRR